MTTRPSALATNPCRSNDDPGPGSAQAPTGTEQFPPNPANTDRSARSARCELGSSRAASSSRVAASPARHCTAMAPCPAWGSRSTGSRMSVRRSVQPNRSMAATATTTAVTEPSSPRLTRRSMLPLISVKLRSGRRLASWARRRAEPVAMRPPGGRSRRRHPTRPSRGSARSGTAARTSPSTMTEVMSLAEWTAASARPSATAASTSVTKTP